MDNINRPTTNITVDTAIESSLTVIVTAISVASILQTRIGQTNNSHLRSLAQSININDNQNLLPNV